MKISEMLLREDFYTINEKTLRDFFGTSTEAASALFVYPKLNAIVTRRPAKAVRNYLLTEYAVRSPLKRLAAQSYVRACLSSRGLLADRKITLPAAVGDRILIYPCNKKVRVFDFGQNTVSVIMKHGFDRGDLLHEIEFRKRDDLPDFVPPLVSCSETGYTETILPGKPLARVTDERAFETLRQTAYDLFRQSFQQDDGEEESGAYLDALSERILSASAAKPCDEKKLRRTVARLAALGEKNASIPVGFSHGDLQAGNIWIGENDRIYLIDWESWGIRSLWYDKAVLFGLLRPGDVRSFLGGKGSPAETAVVLLEDLLFQLNERNSLPHDFGQDRFDRYLNSVSEWLGE